MTLPRQDREKDLESTVRMMMEELGPRWYALLLPDGDKPPYDQVMSTTWRELTRRGYVKDRELKRYEFTAAGWFYGVALLDLPNQPDFRSQISRLSATLKGYVKGRADDVLKDIYSVAKDGAVSRLKTSAIGQSARIGLTRNVDRRLRFYERGNPYVSGPKRLRE